MERVSPIYGVILLISYFLLLSQEKKQMEYILLLGGIPNLFIVIIHLREIFFNGRLDYLTTTFGSPFLFCISYGRSWYEFGLFSFSLLVLGWLTLYLLGDMPVVTDTITTKHVPSLVMLIILLIVVYSFAEKVLKELWVMADSRNKSFGIFKNIMEAQINPTFILDK